MEFTLKITQSYLDDLDNLPKEYHDKITYAHNQLQSDPKTPGLFSKKFQGITKFKAFRSRVDDDLRIAWRYGDFDRSIILWRVGHHEMIDSLDKITWMPDFNIIEKIQRSVPFHKQNSQSSKDNNNHQRAKQPKIFQRITPIQLRLIGVPEDLVTNIQDLSDGEDIYQFNLPSYTQQILLDYYTNPEWSPDCLLDVQQVLYRTSADQLSDYCAGKTRQLMLDLTTEQKNIVNVRFNGAYLVKGVAGSGKTTVGVYRAFNLSKNRGLFADKPILFITYNETLAQVVRKLFEELTLPEERKNLSSRIQSLTLRDWANTFLQTETRKYDLRQAENILNKIISRELPDDKNYLFFKQESFFMTEIYQVIKGRGINNWEEYKGISRVGRGQPLQQSQRKIVWNIYCKYQKSLQEAKIYDEGDLYLEAKTRILKDNNFQSYPGVIVDEAQDLTPIALELTAILAGGSGSSGLCLVADPSQSIYYQGISWKESGVEITGRVKTLSKNFRNSRQILQAAWAFAESNPGEFKDEIIVPDQSKKVGPKPRVIETPNQSDQDIKYLKELIANLTGSNRYRPSDIAVLSRQRETVKKITNMLKHSGIPVCHFRDESFDIFENNIKVITINSAKGLEFPVVILMNVEEGHLPRDLSYLTNDDTFASKMRIERQLFYVAMTRAAEELYMIFPSGRQSRFIREIPLELVTFHLAENQ